jgi:hypothetical protein
MIYFAQDESTLHVKIGFHGGEDALERIKSLQTGNPSPLVLLGTMPGDRDTERRLHRDFAAARVAGEWFRPVAGLLALIISPAPTPVQSAPWPLNIYLAGKISEGDWRHSLVDGLDSVFDHNCGDDYGELVSLLNDTWPILPQAIFNQHSYVGPYFLGNCGHCPAFGDDTHGVALGRFPAKRSGGHQPEQDVTVRCLEAIKRANLLFAWVDQSDCYGTILEIGYALACGVDVCVAGPRQFRDMWFVYEAATWDFFRTKTPERGLAWFLAQYSKD